MTTSRPIHVAANGIILAVKGDLMLFTFHLISGQRAGLQKFYFLFVCIVWVVHEYVFFFLKKGIKLSPHWDKVILLTITANFLTPFGTRLGTHSSIDYNSI